MPTPTELLSRVVIPHLDATDLQYQLVNDNLIQVWMREGTVRFEFYIYDYKLLHTPALHIRVLDFEDFPAAQATYAKDMVNQLNMRGLGKFILDDEGDLSYQFDWPVSKNSGPEHFHEMTMLALSTFMSYRPIVMKVKWANATVAQAIAQLKEEPRTFSPDDIEELMNRPTSEDRDPEEPQAPEE